MFRPAHDWTAVPLLALPVNLVSSATSRPFPFQTATHSFCAKFHRLTTSAELEINLPDLKFFLQKLLLHWQDAKLAAILLIPPISGQSSLREKILEMQNVIAQLKSGKRLIIELDETRVEKQAKRPTASVVPTGPKDLIGEISDECIGELLEIMHDLASDFAGGVERTKSEFSASSLTVSMSFSLSAGADIWILKASSAGSISVSLQW